MFSHQTNLTLCSSSNSFFYPYTETHGTLGQDSDGVQITEDVSSAHRGHCPHGYRRSRPGVRSRRRASLLLVKNTGAWGKKEEKEEVGKKEIK